MNLINRRTFLQDSSLASLGLGLGLMSLSSSNSENLLFKISLAEWSLNKPLFAGKISNLDFPVVARKNGIEAVEYVNQFFMDKAKDKDYLKELKSRSDGEGVRNLLIMCDREGNLGDPDKNKRLETVENHKKWVEAAQFLGCHSIRVNGYSKSWTDNKKDFKETMKLVADGLNQLCTFADGFGLNVIIENHGGFSSNAKWLAGVMKMTDHGRAGTLPDFGNFRIHKSDDQTVSYDTYKGVKKLMPYAKGVSVKTIAWDNKGNSSPLDYERITKIVLDSGFRGYFGIEHGPAGKEWEGILEVKQKLMDVRKALAVNY